MRRLTLALIIYTTHAFAPPYTLPSVTEAAGRVVSATKFVKPSGSQKVNRRTRLRVRRVVHRKPPTVIVYPDVIRVMSAAEVGAERKAKEGIRWVTWF